MDCFQCGATYNEKENCPRLLIECGHSLCQKCLIQCCLQGSFSCPECGTLHKSQNISDFPKNLALLHLKSPPLVEKRSNPSFGSEVGNSRNQEAGLVCRKHKKKIEAFCENDRQLLCITCILEEGYKNQDICSIEEAAQKEKNLIQKAFELSQIIEGKITNLQKEILETNDALAESAEKSRIEITQFFNEIRKAISERETAMKQAISEQLKKNETLLRKKVDNVNKHLANVIAFYEEYERSLSEKELQLLDSSTKRIEIIKKATMDVEKLESFGSFPELNRESELNNLLKSFQQPKVIKEITSQPQTQTGKNVKAHHVQANLPKPKGNKEPLNKHSNFVPVRASTSLKKDVNSLPPTTSSHSFAFSIIDNKNAPKEKGQSKEHKNKDENKKVEKKSESFVEPAHIKNKPSQNPYTIRSLQKEREALKEKNSIDNNKSQNQEEKLQDTITSLNKQKLHIEEEEEENIVDSLELPSPKHQINHMTSINENKLLSRGNSNIQQKWAIDSIKSEPQPEDTKPQLKMPMWSLTKEESENLLNMWNTNKKDLLVEADLAKSVELQFNPTSDEITYRKDIKLIPTDNTHCSTLGDIVDIANQKLDFSMLCQQSNSYIYTMGGFVEDSQCFVEKYDLQKGKWEIAGTFYNNRTKFCSLVLPQEGTILIMGGKMEGNRAATCEEYCLIDQVIKPSDITLSSQKSGFGALLFNNEIYICGGNDGYSILKTFESYNFKTKKWTQLPNLLLKRDELAVVVGLDQKIYAIGGFGGSGNACLADVERYDPQKGIWEPIASLNTPRRALAAVALPDGIYAIGGFDGENYLSTVERYEESTNEWIYVSSMNYPRCTLSAVISNDFRNIFVLGGFDNGPLKTVERFSVIDNTWEIIQPMHFKRFMHTAVFVTKPVVNNKY